MHNDATARSLDELVRLDTVDRVRVRGEDYVARPYETLDARNRAQALMTGIRLSMCDDQARQAVTCSSS